VQDGDYDYETWLSPREKNDDETEAAAPTGRKKQANTISPPESIEYF
jgi:hypothetical protein